MVDKEVTRLQITKNVLGRKFTKAQLLRFPILMSAILTGVITFWWTFSRVNRDRIKLGSKKFTDAPKVTFTQEK